MIVQQLHGGVAETPLRHIDDALEGEIVGRRIDHAQIGERIADFGAFVEARPADDPIGQPERDKAILEFAHLERGAHQDGDLVERMTGALQLLDLFADGAGFFFRVPRARDGDLLARHVVGAQRLAEPAFVMGDQMRGGGQDMAGGAVIALEAYHRGAGKIVLEAQYVVDLGAAPAIDRLIVVADAADVFGLLLPVVIPGRAVRREPEIHTPGVGGYRFRARRFAAPRNDGFADIAPLRQQPQPQILRHIGVLIFVDQDVFEAGLILPQHFGVLAEQPDAFEQEVAEVGGVEDFQPVLKRPVELQPLAVGEGGGLAGRHLLGRQPAVFPAVDQAGEHARRPAFLVDALGLQNLLQQPDLIIDVQNGEVGLEPDQFGVAAQNLHADRMERAEPGHALDHLADNLADAVLHLARRLVGEGDGENFARPGAPEAEDVGDAHGQHAGLAGAGAGQHQDRAVERLDRLPLFGIKPGQIGRRRRSRERPRGNAAGRGSRRFGRLDAALQRVSQSFVNPAGRYR